MIRKRGKGEKEEGEEEGVLIITPWMGSEAFLDGTNMLLLPIALKRV